MAHYIGLHLIPVAHLRDVVHIDRSAVDGFDRQAIECIHNLRRVVHLDPILAGADFRAARRQDDALLIECSGYVSS